MRKYDMKLLFAVDENWNIGYENDLLIKISEDLKRFRKMTTNNIIIMGRRTFESLPESKPLPNRTNIIVTRDKDYKVEDAIVVNSIEELYETLDRINPHGKLSNYMIGGGNIVKQLIDSATQAYITKIYKKFEKADTSMINLDKLDDWEHSITSDIYYQDDVPYQYFLYNRVK